MRLLFVLILGANIVVANAAPASGAVQFREVPWKVADAIAWHDDDEIEIVFSSIAFDRAEMKKDGKLDTFDFMRGDGNQMVINLEADGPTMCLDITTRSGDTTSSGSNCNSEFTDAIKISKRSNDHVAGSMKWSGSDGDLVDVKFDLPIESAASVAASKPAGTPLPSDGGAPGKALLAQFAALAAGDWNTFKASAHPDRRKMMEASEKTGEHTKMFEFLQSVAPRAARITGGTINGAEASVNYTGTIDGHAVNGAADVIEFEGKWYVAGTQTNDG